ncbi:MAG: HD domain-containing phosphohydrolase [Candidatus Omnitrophota bacterium]
MPNSKLNNEYQKEFFKRLLENAGLKNKKQAFSEIFGHPIWWIIEEKNTGLDFKEPDLTHCKTKCKGVKNFNFCRKDILTLLAAVRKTHQSKTLICPGGMRGVCFPLAIGEKLYGYFFFCHLNEELTSQIMGIFSAFLGTILREVQKELELSKLYETIRPRAIALSTIHTIHRLISSLLKLEELLPRIARLSLQVLRANKCSILLLDENKKHLVSKTTVDLSGKMAYSKKMRLGKGVENRVAKTGNAVLHNTILAVPLVHEEIMGVITVQSRIDKKPFDVFDKEILSTLAEQAVIAIKNAELYEEQERVTIGSIKSLATILDTKSPYTYTHSSGFIKLVLALAEELGLSEEETRHLHYAALLPDAGKIWVPEEILKKSSRLTGKEYKLVKEHPIKGVEIIKHIEVLKPVIPIILHHHERYDGTGYPNGLKKDKIPLGARIMALADAFEAMIYKRPYRSAMSIKSAVAEIKRHSGKQFDPKVVSAFLRLIKSKQLKGLFKNK